MLEFIPFNVIIQFDEFLLINYIHFNYHHFNFLLIIIQDFFGIIDILFIFSIMALVVKGIFFFYFKD